MSVRLIYQMFTKLLSWMVLHARLIQRLGEVSLQLHGGDREPVDEEDQVDAALIGGGEMHLPHHAYPHRRVLLVGGRVQARLGPELRHLQPATTDVLHPVAQNVQRPAAVLERLVERRDQYIEDAMASVWWSVGGLPEQRNDVDAQAERERLVRTWGRPCGAAPRLPSWVSAGRARAVPCRLLR